MFCITKEETVRKLFALIANKRKEWAKAARESRTDQLLEEAEEEEGENDEVQDEGGEGEDHDDRSGRSNRRRKMKPEMETRKEKRRLGMTTTQSPKLPATGLRAATRT